MEQSVDGGRGGSGKAPPAGCTYRTASVEDAEAVSGLLREQYVEHRISAPMDELIPAVERLIGTPESGMIFIASHGPKIVGTAVMTFTWSIEHRGRIAWLDELYIVPGWREKGVGKALLGMVKDRADEEGCRAVELEVDHEHERAEALYLREGFERVTRNRFVQRSY